ncbi:MAG: serine hydrolase [Bacteroidota bacterium]
MQKLLYATALSLFAFACTTPPPTEEAPAIASLAWVETDPLSLGYTEEELDESLQYIVDSSNTTGLVVIIDGKQVLEYGDIEELSYLASCRKSILAMLYGKYVENGTIDLSKTLVELGIDDHQGLSDLEKQATIDHLITARSGIYHPASNSGDNSADAPERSSQQPGEYFLYNNWDFNAAGFIFESLTGKNIYDEVEAQLAIPLGFEDWDRSAQRKSGNLERSKYPAYHMWISTRDMAKIGQLMLNEGNWNGQQIISQSWAQKIVSLITPLEDMNPTRMRDGYFGYGYMWWVWDGPEVPEVYQGAYSARGAWGQYITVIPSLNMVIAHKTKSTYRRRTSWNQYMGIVNRAVDYLGE